MSPRAAWRLESLGFTTVYDYVAGKMDWAAAGLATEGSMAGVARLGDAAVDVPRCHLDEKVGEVRSRLGGADVSVVVNDGGVVLGVVSAEGLGAGEADDRSIADVMREGPSTFRPNVAVEGMRQQLQDRGLPRALVTRLDGTLIGVVRLEDLLANGS